MSKLLQYGMAGVLSLALATPAMALTGYGPNNTDNGSHWENHFMGQGEGPNGQTWGQSDNNGNYGQNGYSQNGYSQNGYNQNSRNGYSGGQNYGSNEGNENGNNGGMNQAVTQGFVAHLQRRLQQQGFYHQGSVDGMWGPETQSALENFQQQNNLRPTGQIDMRTLQALNMLNGNNGRYGQNGRNYGQNSQQYGQNGNGYNGNDQNYSNNMGYNGGNGNNSNGNR